MRVPQVNERVKEAPAQALRAMFAGLGQLLSVSDKIRNKAAAARPPAGAKTAAPETTTTREPSAAPEPKVAPEPSVAPAAEVAPAPSATPEAKVAPETSAAPEPKVAPETSMAPEPKVAPETPATPKPAGASTPAGSNVRLLPPEEAAAAAAAASAPATTAASAGASAPAATAPAELPLANYDGLTIASLRARLRNLSADQLNQLIDYEKSHAARPDVISMFERRIAKLAEG